MFCSFRIILHFLKFHFPRTCSEVVTGVVTKCLGASKQKTKDKGMEVAMLYIEAEKPDIVQVMSDRVDLFLT